MRFLSLSIWLFFVAATLNREQALRMGWFATIPLTILALLVMGDLLRRARAVEPCVLWFLAVSVGGFAAELIGVHTGVIFGEYRYSPALTPSAFGVPLVIGFAWCLVSVFAVECASRVLSSSSPWFAPVGGIAVTLFDMTMEPAAVALGLWEWQGAAVPLRNYFAWYLIGTFFVWLAQRLAVVPEDHSPLPLHVGVAQMLFFLGLAA